MKKSLLLSVLGILGAGAPLMAENAVIPDQYLSALSPDGRYVVSAYYGNLAVFNRVNGDVSEYFANDEGTLYYENGLGNCMSQTGMLLGNTTPNFDGSYWQDGEWHTLYQSDKYDMVILNGVTPDASRVVGNVDNPDNTLGYDGTVMVPAFWDRNADGTYSEPTLLPRPELDFSGRLPQYITATCVSPDGKTVVGQVVDYSGSLITPIVYTCDENGEWSYNLPAEDLINPNHIELPEAMEMPEYPEAKDFMSAEMREAYEKDLLDYINSGYDPAYFPDEFMYLTDEEYAAYEEALDEYFVAAEKYNEWLDVYFPIFYQIVDESVTFVFNSAVINPDGTKYEMPQLISGEDFWSPSTYSPYVFDLVNGGYKVYKGGENIYPTKLFNNGDFLAYELSSWGGSPNPQSFYHKADGEAYGNLYDHLREVKPKFAEWMDENMRHDVEYYDADGNLDVLEDAMVQGFVLATEDLSTVAFGVSATWENEDDTYYYMYILQDDLAGIECVPVASKSQQVVVNGRRGGVIEINGDAASMEVYDTNGRLVYSASRPEAAVNTGLASGVYVVKTTSATGENAASKVVF